VLVIVVVAVSILFAFIARDGRVSPDRLESYKLYVEVLKAVVIGFGIALFGILLPAILAEARSKFERLKESRDSYSQAKTGAEYLPLRLATMSLKDAVSYIQQVHVQKHQAELYDELAIWLKRRPTRDGKAMEPYDWSEGIYNALRTGRTVLEHNASVWDGMTASDRVKLFGELGVGHEAAVATNHANS
jgi:hypothetical protein